MLRLPVRSVFRVRRRSLTTALAIVFAYVLILMVWGLPDSIEFFFTGDYEVIERRACRWTIGWRYRWGRPSAPISD